MIQNNQGKPSQPDKKTGKEHKISEQDDQNLSKGREPGEGESGRMQHDYDVDENDPGQRQEEYRKFDGTNDDKGGR